jgi:hypothetical protein
MKLITMGHLLIMSRDAKEKRLDELNRKLDVTQPRRPVQVDKEEFEEREWLKKKLGYGKR